MALRPIRIEEKGSALTCAEYDANIDRVLDRSNHTGKQPCDTLSDLEECLTESEIIVEIKETLDELRLSLEEVENSLSDGGDLSDRLAVLRADLFSLIQKSASDILDLQQGVKNIEASIVSLNANLNALSDLLDFYIENQTNANTVFETQVNTLIAQLSSLTTNLTTLRSDLSVEVSARMAGDSTLRVAVEAEATTRLNADKTLEDLLNTVIAGQSVSEAGLISLLNSKAPKNSPVFNGSPANFSTGAVVPEPAIGAVGSEVINASWFNKNYTDKTADITNLINSKAPKASPEFSGTLNSSGPSYFNHSLYTVDPGTADKSNRVPNTNWIWGHINNLNSSINGKASLYNPSFTANIEVKGEATFQGTSRFNYLAHFSQGARVTIVNVNDPLHVTNKEYVQFYVKGLQDQITDLQTFVNGGGPSVPPVAAYVSFNARTQQIYKQYNVSAVTRRGLGLHSVIFQTKLTGRPIVVGMASRYPSDGTSWETNKANPHVMVWANRGLPNVDGNGVDVYINANEGVDLDPVDADYVAIIVFN